MVSEVTTFNTRHCGLRRNLSQARSIIIAIVKMVSIPAGKVKPSSACSGESNDFFYISTNVFSFILDTSVKGEEKGTELRFANCEKGLALQ